MTTPTTAPPNPTPGPKPTPGREAAAAISKTLESFSLNQVEHAAVAAVVSWLAGAALAAGFHVSIPFWVGMVVLWAGLFLLSYVTGLVTRVFHLQKAKSIPHLAAAERAAQLYTEHVAEAMLPTILADLAKKAEK
jgi:hypothetical protein